MTLSLSGILLGIFNIAIFVAVFMLIGALVLWGVRAFFNTEVPDYVRKAYMAVVGIIALAMIVALLIGIPLHWRVI